MKINQSNLHYVAHLLRKHLPNDIFSQYFYNKEKKLNSILRYFNIPDVFPYFLYEVEKSNLGYMKNIKIDLESYYIRVGNGKEAFVLHIGDEIKFGVERITIKCKHPTKKSKCTHLITF